jgi:hypothetical protein
VNFDYTLSRSNIRAALLRLCEPLCLTPRYYGQFDLQQETRKRSDYELHMDTQRSTTLSKTLADEAAFQATTLVPLSMRSYSLPCFGVRPTQTSHVVAHLGTGLKCAHLSACVDRATSSCGDLRVIYLHPSVVLICSSHNIGKQHRSTAESHSSVYTGFSRQPQ